MHTRRFAGVVAFHGERLVLVRERHEHWGGAFWNIPSGSVESHETPAGGAARELAEETGLLVTPEDLRLVGTSSTTGRDHRSLAWNFTTTVHTAVIDVADPDGLIIEAAWFTRDEAIDLLGRLPYRPLGEPVTAYLSNGVDLGAHWRYDTPEADPVVTGSGGSQGVGAPWWHPLAPGDR